MKKQYTNINYFDSIKTKESRKQKEGTLNLKVKVKEVNGKKIEYIDGEVQLEVKQNVKV